MNYSKSSQREKYRDQLKIQPCDMSFSSQITAGGELANLSFNDTRPLGADDESGSIWQWDDATWILAASFIIFSMQTGPTEGKSGFIYYTAFTLHFVGGFDFLSA